MIKADKTVINETKYIAYSLALMSVIMQSVFLILKRWDYTVLLGNLLTDAVMILNFFCMGLTIQKAVSSDEKDAKNMMKLSQSLRTLFIFVAAVVGVVLPCFSTIAVIIPMFFPRIAIALRSFVIKRENEEGGANAR